MRVYKKDAVKQAFSYVALQVRQGNKKIALCKIPGLSNFAARSSFKDAVSHSFNYRTHGFNLDQIFKIDKNGDWNRVPKTNNPADDSVIDLIIRAMSYINQVKKEELEFKKSGFSVEKSQSATDEELIAEIKKRGYIVFKTM
jgi:hypothetical protein